LLGANESTGKKNTNQHVPIYWTQINILLSHQFSQLELNMQESCAGIYILIGRMLPFIGRCI